MLTAAVGLYRNLRLPLPSDRSNENSQRPKIPLIINGASSSVGAFAVKLAKLSPSIGPIIVTASSGADFVKNLGGVDEVVDYKSPCIVNDLQETLNGQKMYYVLDASNNIQSVTYLTSDLEPTGWYTCTTSVASGLYGEGEQQQVLENWGDWCEQVWVGSIPEDKLPGTKWFGSIMSRLIETYLFEGKFSGHPHEIVQGGLNGVELALIKLRDRKSGNESLFPVLLTPRGAKLDFRSEAKSRSGRSFPMWSISLTLLLSMQLSC